MIFPITELLDEHESQVWVEKYFHPKGLRCPGCEATREQAREFRRHKRGFVDYRCHTCQRTYNLYTGTIFAGSNLEPRRVVLLVRGICKGEPATVLAEELALSRQCVSRWRKRLQANSYARLSAQALPDRDTETDEMCQNAGEKGEKHAAPLAPPRRRANTQRGHGTYDNDRPPIVGPVGRPRGQCRLRVRHHTDGKTWQQHVQGYTHRDTTGSTDEWQGYNQLKRTHHTVCHGQKEWARDDDGDGIREVHTNTIEGLWTTARNFLRPFRGVHKKYLHHYLAMCEHKINLKRISPKFIARLVTQHRSVT